MSTQLYWDNLGFRSADRKREAVVRSASEIHGYLKRAERRLSLRTYHFRFNVQEVIVSPLDAEGRAALATAKDVFLDEAMRKRLPSSARQDRGQSLLSLRSPPLEHVFVFGPEQRAQKVQLKVRQVLLSDLDPVDVTEEEEDFALDLLFEQSDSVYDPVASSASNRLSILRRNRNERYVILDALPQGKTVVARYDTHVIRSEYRALESLILHPKSHQVPLLNLLQGTHFVEWEDVDTNQRIQYRILTDESKPGTSQQREFVRRALGTPDFAILEGPPGSGKTTTILELILQLIPKGKRVLLVASTHVAVDNVIEKLIETRSEGKTLEEKYGVVPLRLGRLDVISEKVQRYQVDNLVTSERERLKEFLGRLPKRTESQELLYEALLKGGHGDEVIESLVLESANLVCGTTIGVLQSKFIKEPKMSKPPFNYLILDEASKTTFQEFLVPALHAARWVLSGDVRQLAPYVDQAPIRENLAKLASLQDEVGEEDKRIVADVFHSARGRGRRSFGRLVITPDGSDLAQRYRAQAAGLQQVLLDSGDKASLVAVTEVKERPHSMREKLELMGSSIVLVPKSALALIEGSLPPSLLSDQLVSDSFQRRSHAYASYLKKMGSSDSDRNYMAWEDEVAWRLSRLYELRELKDRQAELLLDLQLLLPRFQRADYLAKERESPEGSPPRLTRDQLIFNEIRRIERIALPSVLELLQKGYKQHEEVDEEFRIPLYDGLSAAVLSQRHVLLEYQHRMAYEISAFPRMHIYAGAALKDSPELESSRRWSYDVYPHHSVWVNVYPTRNDLAGRGSRTSFNQAELRTIVSQLRRFMSWSRDHPCPEPGSNGYWSVALLSFYKGQENKLSDAMRTMFGSRAHRYFRSDQNRLTVEVCTVDRFQGHEADLVFLSMVNSGYKIGFLDNPNRLNVALTRAKYQLVIVGDRRTFAESRRTTDLLRGLAGTTPDGPIEFGGS
jgi:AAA domain